MVNLCIITSLIPLVGIVAYLAILLGLTSSFDFSPYQKDYDCLHLTKEKGHNEIMHSSEDLVHLGNGIFLFSSGDLLNVFHGVGPDHTVTPGALWALKLNTNANDIANNQAEEQAADHQFMKLRIQGIPANLPFQPHGLFYSNITNLVYVVSHGMDGLGLTGAQGGSRIILLKIKGDYRANLNNLELTYVTSITSPLFNNGAINDVVEGDLNENELYVSEWLQYPLPLKGKHFPSNLNEKINNLKQTVAQIIFPNARIFKCNIVNNNCTVELDYFYMANGLTKQIIDNKHFYYFNDLASKTIHVYKRNEVLNKLEKINSIKLEFAVDNIEYDYQTNQFYAGSILQPYKNMLFMDAGMDIAVPFGMTRISLNGSDYKVDNYAFLNDGSKMKTGSCAFEYGPFIVLGGPFAEGLLVCRKKDS